MATSRLERIGTIYSRITGLLRSQAMKPDNKPIWYEVYQAFPPKYPPKYERPVPNIEVPQIFYPEDKIRAKIHKEKSAIVGTVTLQSTRDSNTQRCITHYEELVNNGLPEQEALEKAIERTVAEIPVKPERVFEPQQRTTTTSLAEEFKRSKGINLKDIMKD